MSKAPRLLPALSAATWPSQHAVAAPHEATPLPLAVLERAEHGPTLALAHPTQHAVTALEARRVGWL